MAITTKDLLMAGWHEVFVGSDNKAWWRNPKIVGYFTEGEVKKLMKKQPSNNTEVKNEKPS